MKKILILLSLVVLTSFKVYEEYDSVVKIKVYMVRWDAKYRIIRTTENIQQNYLYYFEKDGTSLSNMFDDYDDCLLKLQSQSRCQEECSKKASAFVEMVFEDNKVVRLYFKNTGEYYFDGKWYTMNEGLYYYLFRYFSNELIPKRTLSKAMLETSNDFWKWDD